MADGIGPLRWYAALAVVFFGILPAVLVSMLVLRGDTAAEVGWLLLGGIPLVGAGVVFAVRGWMGSDPEVAARRLNTSMALVAGADVLMLGGNALLN